MIMAHPRADWHIEDWENLISSLERQLRMKQDDWLESCKENDNLRSQYQSTIDHLKRLGTPEWPLSKEALDYVIAFAERDLSEKGSGN